MNNNPSLWEVRTLSDGLALELWAGANPALVLAQGERRVRVELPHARGVGAALNDSLHLKRKRTSDGTS